MIGARHPFLTCTKPHRNGVRTEHDAFVSTSSTLFHSVTSPFLEWNLRTKFASSPVIRCDFQSDFTNSEK